MAPRRPRCSVFLATSVDGFLARVDGAIDWLRIVEAPGEDYGYQAFIAGVDALVMGRNTYEVVRGFPAWPYEGKRCVVLTHRPGIPAHGETFSAEAPGALLERLGGEGVAHVYVDGGQVVRQFLAARCVDEVTWSIVPVVLGAGRSVFVGAGEAEWRLVDARPFPSGLVQLRYRPR